MIRGSIIIAGLVQGTILAAADDPNCTQAVADYQSCISDQNWAPCQEQLNGTSGFCSYVESCVDRVPDLAAICETVANGLQDKTFAECKSSADDANARLANKEVASKELISSCNEVETACQWEYFAYLGNVSLPDYDYNATAASATYPDLVTACANANKCKLIVDDYSSCVGDADDTKCKATGFCGELGECFPDAQNACDVNLKAIVNGSFAKCKEDVDAASKDLARGNLTDADCQACQDNCNIDQFQFLGSSAIPGQDYDPEANAKVFNEILTTCNGASHIAPLGALVALTIATFMA